MDENASGSTASKGRLREVALWKPVLVSARRSDGTVYIRQEGELGPYPDKLTERLVHWAQVAPKRTFLAQRGADGAWRRLTYQEVLDRVLRLGSALLDAGLDAERPVVILSGNDFEHAILGLACQYVGVPYAPVSPAYSLLSNDHGKLKEIARLLRPGLIYAADGKRYAAAIEAAFLEQTILVVGKNPPAGRPRIHLFADFSAASSASAVQRAFESVTPEQIVKFLFTSGSTGSPKAVIQTQRMLCANQAMVADCYAYMQDEPPIVVDWAPWHHTASGNKVFNMVLYNGGTYHIDDGKPAPAAIEATARNLREISPTWYFNVPKGYEELVPRLEADPVLRETFFARVKMLMYAGAGMAQHTWDSLNRLSIETIGERVLLASGLGSTETGPFALMCTEEQAFAGNIGIPAKGCELKLVPWGDKLEARLRGPHITPGYLGEPGLTAEAFDEEGFYKLGDALRFADPNEPLRGFFFDGRLAENFKLRTGTWVAVGALRAALVNHFGPIVRDAVISGEDQDILGALLIPDPAACQELAPDAPADRLFDDERVKLHFLTQLRSFALAASGSSTRIARAMILAEPLLLDKGEVTDKGSINQRAVLRHRAHLVERLHAEAPDPRVLDIGAGL